MRKIPASILLLIFLISCTNPGTRQATEMPALQPTVTSTSASLPAPTQAVGEGLEPIGENLDQVWNMLDAQQTSHIQEWVDKGMVTYDDGVIYVNSPYGQEPWFSKIEGKDEFQGY